MFLTADFISFGFHFSSVDDDFGDDSDSSSIRAKSESEMISSNIARDEEGLILPKKLSSLNPCLQSSDRQNLHRELLFNQKM